MRLELLGTLVERQLRLRSKRSVFGVVWPLAAPLLLLALYLFVFTSVFTAPVDRYGVYLFAGLLPWTFLVQASHDALQSISFEPELVRRAPMPYHYLPLARVVVMAIPFLALLVAFVVYLAVVGDEHLRPVLLPMLAVPVASTLLVVATIAVLLALLDVFSRDLRYVLHNLLTVWFFLVPIVYDRRMVGPQLQAVTAVDPMRRVVEQYRDVLYDGRIASPVAHVVTLGACAALFLASLVLFRRLAVDLAKDV
ncbi:MAG: ABC transporter permease [Actinomycetota bacterium]|nr:ABC transporter permease [Acidimicrobiia bacterium]MDQ3294860.1 ABC transporter permease [Actinomycetota bacterium]